MEGLVSEFNVGKFMGGIGTFLKWLLIIAVFLACLSVAFLISYFSLFNAAPDVYKGLGPIDMRLDIVAPKPGEVVIPQWSTTPLTPGWVMPVSWLISTAVAGGLAWVFKVIVEEMIPEGFNALRWQCHRLMRFVQFQRDLFLLWDALAPVPHRKGWWEQELETINERDHSDAANNL